jgi:hypothetical protein
LPLPLVESQAVAFPPGTALRIEGGYDAAVIRSVHADGIHELEVDLRDWTARLIQELEIELEKRGVVVIVPAASLDGTSIEPRPSPHVPRDPSSLRVLRVRVLEVTAPDREEGRWPFLAARIESAPEGFAASFTAGEHARGFRDALYELKKKILDDSRFQAWIRSACSPAPSGALDRR